MTFAIMNGQPELAHFSKVLDFNSGFLSNHVTRGFESVGECRIWLVLLLWFKGALLQKASKVFTLSGQFTKAKQFANDSSKLLGLF